MPVVPDIARNQDGVFTRAQAAEAGFSYRRIRRLVDDGEWRIVVGSAYVHLGTSCSPRQVARALSLLSRSVVSHASAAALFGIHAGAGMHVTIEPHRSLTLSGVRVHHHTLIQDDVVVLGGVPVTGRMRTVVDLLADLPLPESRTLLFRAIQQDWLRRPELSQAIDMRVGWKGTPQLRQLLSECEPGAHSWLEAATIRLLRGAGLGGWDVNAAVTDARGLIGVVDFLFREHKLVIEVDGRRYHGEDRFQSDRTRQNRLVRAGYSVLRFTYDDIVRNPELVIQTIRATLARLAA